MFAVRQADTKNKQAQKNRKRESKPMRHTPFLSLFPSLPGRRIFAAAQRHPRKIPVRLRAVLAGLLLLLPGLAAAAPFAYIANNSSNTVSVIDTANNTVIDTVTVGSSPFGVAVSPDGARVYVTNNFDGNVSIIDTADNSVTTVTVGSYPYGVAVNPAGTRVYVTNNSDDNVSIIDTADNSVTTVTVGSWPYGVAVNPVGTRVYVANGGSNTVSIIDTADNSVTTVPVGNYPFGVAVSPDGARVYVTNESSNTVSVIDTANSNSVTATVAVGAHPYGVAVSPDGTRVYVTNSFDGNVSIIDTADNSVTTVPVGNYPYGVAVSPDGARVYVTNESSDNVSVIDTVNNTVIATVTVGSQPYSLGQFIGEPPSVPDTSPNPFGFTAQTNVALNTVATSNAITVSGINAPSVIGIVGGSYSINGGGYTTVAGTVTNGQTVTVRQTSSASFSTLTTATLTIGGVAGVFDVTTLAVGTSYTAPSAAGTGAISASFTGGGAGCGYSVRQYIPLSGHAASPPAGSAPAGVSFPHGLFDFTTGGCTPGSTITMVVTYPQALPAGTVYWKYGPTPTDGSYHWYQLPAVIAGNTATFSITDGGLGDDDLTANGIIVDQGGPGVPGGGGAAP
ncbi:MAG: YncE family protein, partial [Porticoccaceae bacterium]|nr:YncE family protein [Porticoccaceae bacterium]